MINYFELHKEYKANSLFGRYITLNDIEPLLSNLKITVIGESVLGKPIYNYVIGCGKTKIFMWSQMHGNESTTTKALFDFFNLLLSDTNNYRVRKVFNALSITDATIAEGDSGTRLLNFSVRLAELFH